MKYQNNPYNIRRYKTNRWFGSIASCRDKFESFSRLEYGVRAFFLCLRYYYVNLHLRAISPIIMRFAPPSENNVHNYIEYVCRKFEENVPLFHCSGERAFYEITTKQEIFVLARAMALFESGTLISDDVFEKVWTFYHIGTPKFPFDPKYDICTYPPPPSG